MGMGIGRQYPSAKGHGPRPRSTNVGWAAVAMAGGTTGVLPVPGIAPLDQASTTQGSRGQANRRLHHPNSATRRLMVRIPHRIKVTRHLRREQICLRDLGGLRKPLHHKILVGTEALRGYRNQNFWHFWLPDPLYFQN